MPSCPKCGQKKIRKRKDGLRWCRRCGCLGGIARLYRSGNIPIAEAPTATSAAADLQHSHSFGVSESMELSDV